MFLKTVGSTGRLGAVISTDTLHGKTGWQVFMLPLDVPTFERVDACKTEEAAVPKVRWSERPLGERLLDLTHV